MTKLWVICGSSRGVGKTTLAQKLCEVLPKSVYLKCGHGRKKSNKAPNYYHSLRELEIAIEKFRAEKYQHLIIESNAFAKTGLADLVIFIDAGRASQNPRPDCNLLRKRADLILDLRTGRKLRSAFR